MSSIVCMEQKYEKVRKMQIFSEFFYEGGEIPAAFLTVSRRKKSSLRRRELEPAGRPAEIGEKEAQGVI